MATFGGPRHSSRSEQTTTIDSEEIYVFKKSLSSLVLLRMQIHEMRTIFLREKENGLPPLNRDEASFCVCVCCHSWKSFRGIVFNENDLRDQSLVFE